MLPFSILQKNCFVPRYPKLAFEIFIHTGNLESYSLHLAAEMFYSMNSKS